MRRLVVARRWPHAAACARAGAPCQIARCSRPHVRQYLVRPLPCSARALSLLSPALAAGCAPRRWSKKRMAASSLPSSSAARGAGGRASSSPSYGAHVVVLGVLFERVNMPQDLIDLAGLPVAEQQRWPIGDGGPASTVPSPQLLSCWAPGSAAIAQAGAAAPPEATATFVPRPPQLALPPRMQPLAPAALPDAGPGSAFPAFAPRRALWRHRAAAQRPASAQTAPWSRARQQARHAIRAAGRAARVQQRRAAERLPPPGGTAAPRRQPRRQPWAVPGACHQALLSAAASPARHGTGGKGPSGDNRVRLPPLPCAQAITQAFELLRDAALRRRYDTYGLSAFAASEYAALRALLAGGATGGLEGERSCSAALPRGTCAWPSRTRNHQTALAEPGTRGPHGGGAAPGGSNGGGGGDARGEDVHTVLGLRLGEAVTGVERVVELQALGTCDLCQARSALCCRHGRASHWAHCSFKRETTRERVLVLAGLWARGDGGLSGGRRRRQGGRVGGP